MRELKETTQKEKHEDLRKKLWRDVFVSYTRASNSTSVDGGLRWADQALKEFDKRFNITEDKQNYENKQ